MRWQASYEAEDAAHTGSGYTKNGPEGSPPRRVEVLHLRRLRRRAACAPARTSPSTSPWTCPQDGTYDLSVFANSLNTFDKVKEQGPTNVFLRVDGKADSEQELYLPLGYKWVVWDHTDTKVELTKGKHTLTLAAKSLDGKRATKGDAIVDRLTLVPPRSLGRHPGVRGRAGLAGRRGTPVYDLPKRAGPPPPARARSGSTKDETATFWVYSPADARGHPQGRHPRRHGRPALRQRARRPAPGQGQAARVAVSLSGGVNKVTVTGGSATTLVDRLTVTPTEGTLAARTYEAEDAKLAGSATLTPLSLATGGTAITGIGGEPGNGNTATFTVAADRSRPVRAAHPLLQPRAVAEATHYNPDPLARHADISVNGGETRRVSFPHSFHQNNFWELTVPVQLKKGQNTITFRSEELPNFDGTTYASDTFPGVPLRSRYAPLIDRITVAPYARETR